MPDLKNIIDPGDEVEEIKKSKFWHKWFVGYKKIGLIISSIAIFAFIVKTLFVLFTCYQGYQTHSQRLDSLEVQYQRSEKYILAKLDSLEHRKRIIANQHILAVNGIEASLMKDYIYRNVIYKKDGNDVMYYFTSGLLYPVVMDISSGNYYYVDDSGTTIWCR